MIAFLDVSCYDRYGKSETIPLLFSRSLRNLSIQCHCLFGQENFSCLTFITLSIFQGWGLCFSPKSWLQLLSYFLSGAIQHISEVPGAACFHLSTPAPTQGKETQEKVNMVGWAAAAWDLSGTRVPASTSEPQSQGGAGSVQTCARLEASRGCTKESHHDPSCFFLHHSPSMCPLCLTTESHVRCKNFLMRMDATPQTVLWSWIYASHWQMKRFPHRISCSWWLLDEASLRQSSYAYLRQPSSLMKFHPIFKPAKSSDSHTFSSYNDSVMSED